MSDPGGALTPRGLASIGGADLTTVPNPITDVLEIHRATCELGRRLCRDCAIEGSTVSAITIARTEHDRIEPWTDRHNEACVYCGDFATDVDHLVPMPWTGPVARRYVPTVMACRDCNARISAAPVFTIAGRAEIVATSLLRKHGRRLAIPDRSSAVLATFGRRLCTDLTAAQNRRGHMRRRLLVLEYGGAPFAPIYLVLAA